MHGLIHSKAVNFHFTVSSLKRTKLEPITFFSSIFDLFHEPGS